MKYIRAVIKVFLFFASTFGVYGLWFIGDFVIPNKQYWRQFIFRIWAKFFVWLARMEIEIIGEVPKPPFFLVSNHLGYVDIPVLRSVVESVFVAKADLEGWFVAGKIISDMGMIFINRDNRRDIPKAGSKIVDTLHQGEGVIIFPEGTSTKGEEVLPFNSSFFEFAAKTDLPIHYASISYQVDEKEEQASDSICWWDDISFIAHLWKFFQLRGSRAVITFGSEPIVDPNRKKLAQTLWKRVNDKFIPII